MNDTSYQRTIDRPMPDLFFHMMSAMFKIRDFVRPRSVLLDEVPLVDGQTVLDYGCGPGSYIPELAARVGKTGRVVALDIHPLAIQRVEVMAKRQGLRNVETCLTDGVHISTWVDESVDVVLLFDIFHMLSDQAGVLAEIHRVLRPGGTLVVNDPHMDRDVLVAGVTRTRRFELQSRGEYVVAFRPVVSKGCAL